MLSIVNIPWALLLLVCGILILGCLFFSDIPFVKRFAIPAQLIFTLIAIGVAWKLGYSNRDQAAQIDAAKLAAKIAQQETELAKISSKIEYIYVDRVQKIKDVQVVIQEKIKEIAPKIDEKCTITPETVQILNDAAKGEVK